MAVNSATSFILSSILTTLLFSGMQMYRPLLTSQPIFIIFGGFLGSILFLLLLTAVGNLETTLFGKNIQLKLPEVIICLLISLAAAGMIHRICLTTCLIFSIIGLYYINRISQKVYGVTAPLVEPVKSRRHK